LLIDFIYLLEYDATMRSYEQYCALAKALDVIGDRWTLLIVRELLILGSCRYTDLRNGLPGIATNLLADRLRELEQAGIVYHEYAPPPVATTLFHLTGRGKELEAVVRQLARWGAPLLAKSGRKDAFHIHWLTLPLKFHLVDQAPERRPVSIELRVGDESLTIEAIGGAIHTRPGPAEKPDAVLTGTPQLVLHLLLGKLDLENARAAGLKYEGDPAVLRRVQARSASF
jgi:DNA-binding HxlR family transcriptional regulator